MRNIQAKDTKDLKNILGPVYSAVKTYLAEKRPVRRLPWGIDFVSAKPKFHLNDGAGLYFLMVDLRTGEILKSVYGGSGMSTINFTKEQLSEGYTPEEGYALVCIEIEGRSWSVTVVSDNLVRQLNIVQSV